MLSLAAGTLRFRLALAILTSVRNTFFALTFRASTDTLAITLRTNMSTFALTVSAFYFFLATLFRVKALTLSFSSTPSASQTCTLAVAANYALDTS